MSGFDFSVRLRVPARVCTRVRFRVVSVSVFLSMSVYPIVFGACICFSVLAGARVYFDVHIENMASLESVLIRSVLSALLSVHLL